MMTLISEWGDKGGEIVALLNFSSATEGGGGRIVYTSKTGKGPTDSVLPLGEMQKKERKLSYYLQLQIQEKEKKFLHLINSGDLPSPKKKEGGKGGCPR